MMYNETIQFVWNAISSGVAYDALKNILGNGYEKIEKYVKNSEKEKFEIAMEAILETNQQILESITRIINGSITQNHSGNGDNVGRDKIVNHIQNPNSLTLAIEDAMLALKQMPGRLQEAADSGQSVFSFNEAREKIEKLYSVSKATSRVDISNALIDFEEKYNNWLKIINLTINGATSINDVNKFHKSEILDWFEKIIYLPNKEH